MLLFGVPKEQLIDGIKQKEKRADFQKLLLEVVPHLYGYFESLQPEYVHAVAPRYYPIAKDLLLPFKPPFVYGVAGQLHFPWFSFWKSNPLGDEQLAFFVTLVREMMFQDPDLEESIFEILDFSAVGGERSLSIIDTSSILSLSRARIEEMLSVFADGYAIAVSRSDSDRASEFKGKRKPPDADADQLNLW